MLIICLVSFFVVLFIYENLSENRVDVFIERQGEAKKNLLSPDFHPDIINKSEVVIVERSKLYAEEEEFAHKKEMEILINNYNSSLGDEVEMRKIRSKYKELAKSYNEMLIEKYRGDRF